MKPSWKWELPQIAIVLAMFVASALVYAELPERVPVHWNLQGEADRFGSRLEGALGLPLVALGMYLLLRFLPRLDPGKANYEQFQGPYGVIRLASLAVLAGVHAMALAAAFGRKIPMEAAVPVLVGAMFVALGSVLGKVRPNWFVGIRTPWTLSSKASWVKTHRLGGWLFVAGGAASVLSGLALPSGYATGVTLASGLTVSLVCVVYSWAVWRSDPAKLPPAGTLPAD